MNPSLLLEHFLRIAGATEAIPRLRQFILELAVRGKLVDQQPNDEPVSNLLEQIENAKQIQESGMKGRNHLEEVTPTETPFCIPETWKWARLGAITQVVMGQSPPGETYNKIGDGIPLINGPVEFTDGPFGKTVLNQYTTAPTNLCEEGDLLLCVRGSTTGRTNIAASRACIGRGVAAIRPYFADRYVRLFIWRIRASIIELGRGIAFPSINRQQIQNLAVPLPPLAEQQRIVAKVDELMALCDRLEAAQVETERRRERLTAATHAALAAPSSDSAPASFFIRHFPRLTVRPEQIPQLRQTILSLAVCGGLGSPDATSEEESPLREFGLLQNGYAFKSEWFLNAGVQLLRNANVSHGVVSWNDRVCISETKAAEFERFQLSEGDIVLSLDRPFIMTGTKVARVRADDLPCLLLQRVGRFQLDAGRLHSDYLYLWLNSPKFTAQINPGRSNGVPHISSKQVEAAKILVPPLAEQRRIVAKVSELTTLCDRLQANLSLTRDENTRLLESVLHHSLAT